MLEKIKLEPREPCPGYELQSSIRTTCTSPQQKWKCKCKRKYLSENPRIYPEIWLVDHTQLLNIPRLVILFDWSVSSNPVNKSLVMQCLDFDPLALILLTTHKTAYTRCDSWSSLPDLQIPNWLHSESSI
jgi:hypothetical protein